MSANGDTPTTDQVRDGYAHDGLDYERYTKERYEAQAASLYAEFDRWLAAHDAEVAANALEEAAMRADSDWGEFAYIGADGLITYGTVPEMLNDRAAEIRKAAEQ